MPAYPSVESIRGALVARVTAYCDREGIQPRTLCVRAISDPNFFAKVKAGGNFTVKTYSRLQRYLDHEDAKRKAKARRKAKRAAKHRNGGS